LTANTKSVLLTGATGYVGRLLLPRLLERGLDVRCLVRDPSKPSVPSSTHLEVAQGDVLNSQSLEKALQGIDTAYYLVHLMAGDGSSEGAFIVNHF
jgi:uncharacterized protein YbjT (DUF2867 family)